MPPELVLASRSEAAEYLIAESLLVVAISAALVGLYIKSPWALVVMFAVRAASSAPKNPSRQQNGGACTGGATKPRVVAVSA